MLCMGLCEEVVLLCSSAYFIFENTPASKLNFTYEISTIKFVERI
jgi:hypothetical protein